MAVAARVGELLQQEEADALAEARTVGGAREGLAAAVRRQAALAAEVDEEAGRGEDGRAAREGEVALALPQGLGGEVESDQGRGAGGVDGERGPLEAEGVGDPAGGDAGGAAAEVALQFLQHGGGAEEAGGVVLAHQAREDAGAAAAQGGGVDAGAFEGLPGGLQEEALLGVHREGLARGDPEEVGVELGRVVEEAAAAGGGGAGCVGVVGGEEAGGVPAPVGGERGRHVAVAGQQFPEVLGGTYASGVAAAHGDDGDRLVREGGRAGGGGGCRSPGAVREAVADLGGEAGRVRVVEDEGGGQAQAGEGGEPVAQLDGGQRVEAEVLEGAGGTHRRRVLVAEDGRDLGTDEGVEVVGPLLRGERGEGRGEAVGAGLHRLGGPAQGCADQAPQQRRHRAVPAGGGAQRRQVEPDRQEQRMRQGEGAVQEAYAVPGGQGVHARAVQAPVVGGVEVSGHAAGVGPQAPGQRLSGQPQRPPVVCQSVEHRVGGGVGALSGPAEDSGGRGEHHEGIEILASSGRQLVQPQGGVHLRPQHRGEPLGGDGADDAVVQHPGGVDHRRHGIRVQQRGHRVTVGHVTGHHRHLGGTQLQQRVPQLLGALGRRAPTARQEQSAHPVLRDQVPGHHTAQHARPARHQHRSPVAPGLRGGGCVRLGVDAGEPGGEEYAVVVGELGLAQRRPAGQVGEHRPGGGVGVEVEQDQAAGVLGLGGAHQSAHPGGGQVDRALRADPGGRAGDDHQGRTGAAFLVQPAPQQFQRPGDARVDDGGGVPPGLLLGVGVEVGGDHGGQAGAVRLGRREEPAQLGGRTDEGRDGHGGGRRGLRGGAVGQRGPGDLEEGVGRRGALGLAGGGGEGAEREGADAGDGGAGAVGGLHAQRVRAGGGEPYPQLGRALGVDRHVLAGEGEPSGRRVADEGPVAARVQGGVQQGGVHAEGGGLLSRVPLRQGDLGEDLGPPAPHPAQALEDRPVGDVPVGVAVVAAGEVDGLGVLGRPDGEAGARGDRGGAVGEDAHGVAGPGLVGGAHGRGVDAEFASARVVPGADRELEVDAAPLGQGERRLEGDLLHRGAVRLRPGAQGQFEESGPGDDDPPGDHVVREPRVGLQRQPPGQ